MENITDSVAEETTYALEVRLRRIEFVLSGATSEDPVSELFVLRKAGRESTVKAHLDALERELGKLSAKSRTVRDLLDLQANFPEIFKNVQAAAPPSALTSDEKLSTIFSAAPSIYATSSQLTSIKDTPIPDPSISANITSLLPRIYRAEVVQQTQAREIADLRKRSAALLERWYLLGIEGVNECFVEWDKRTMGVDKFLTRTRQAIEED